MQAVLERWAGSIPAAASFISNLKTKNKMKNLSQSEYVIYDFANDHVISFENGKAVIYSNKLEAYEDCYSNEKVISCLDLPLHWQLAILDQINEGL